MKLNDLRDEIDAFVEKYSEELHYTDYQQLVDDVLDRMNTEDAIYVLMQCLEHKFQRWHRERDNQSIPGVE